VQRRPAGGQVQELAGAEPARGAGRLARDAARGAGLPRPAAGLGPGGGRGYRREFSPPGQVFGVGGVRRGQPAGLGHDLPQVLVPRDHRVLRVVIFLVRIRWLVPVTQRIQQGFPVTCVVDRLDGWPGLAVTPGGILVRPGFRGSWFGAHAPSSLGKLTLEVISSNT